MASTRPTADELQRRLDGLAVKHGVPGATVGLLIDDKITVCATGVTRRDSEGVPVTTDTLFLLGSIAKVWTATLVMQLIDQARIGLDDPVNRHLDPPLHLADQQVAEAVTVRQLLTHTGGFYGDGEDPLEFGDDAVQRTVASYADLPQLHRPGRLFSYCNAGYNVLGRLIECVSDSTWDAALQERVIAPLRLERTFTVPHRAMVHPLAVGHDPRPDGHELAPVDVWCDPRGSGPCGSTLAARAHDLLNFARAHLLDGEGPDGQRLLSAAAARQMREPQVSMVDAGEGEAWGLGWEVLRTAEPTVVGHGGNTNGQLSQLYLVPDHGLAICVLTNGDVTGQLRAELCDEVLSQVVGVTVTHRPVPAAPGTRVDLEPFVGSYGREDLRFAFRETDGLLAADFLPGHDAERLVGSFTAAMPYVSAASFLLAVPGFEEVPQLFTFVREDGGDGAATHVSLGGRVLPRLPAGDRSPQGGTP